MLTRPSSIDSACSRTPCLTRAIARSFRLTSETSGGSTTVHWRATGCSRRVGSRRSGTCVRGRGCGGRLTSLSSTTWSMGAPRRHLRSRVGEAAASPLAPSRGQPHSVNVPSAAAASS